MASMARGSFCAPTSWMRAVVCCPVFTSFARTLRMPSASISKVTAMWVSPRPAAGMPESRTSPRKVFSAKRLLSPCATRTCTVVCRAIAVVKERVRSHGTGVFASMRTSQKPPDRLDAQAERGHVDEQRRGTRRGRGGGTGATGDAAGAPPRQGWRPDARGRAPAEVGHGSSARPLGRSVSGTSKTSGFAACGPGETRAVAATRAPHVSASGAGAGGGAAGGAVAWAAAAAARPRAAGQARPSSPVPAPPAAPGRPTPRRCAGAPSARRFLLRAIEQRRLDGRSESDDLVGVDPHDGRSAEELLDLARDHRHARRATDQDDAIEIARRDAGRIERLLADAERALDERQRRPLELRARHAEGPGNSRAAIAGHQVVHAEGVLVARRKLVLHLLREDPQPGERLRLHARIEAMLLQQVVGHALGHDHVDIVAAERAYPRRWRAPRTRCPRGRAG